MKSWIMGSWLQSHDESEWPDLSICQTDDACHVTDMKSHPSKEEIENMCPDEFFAKHKYTYVDNKCLDCPKAGTYESSKSLDISSEHQAAHGGLTLVRDDCGDYDYFYCSKAGTSKPEEHLGISSEDQAAYRCVTHSGGAEDYEFSYVPKAGTSEASVSLDISSEHQAAHGSLTLVRDDCEDYDYFYGSKAGTSEAEEHLGISSEDQAAYRCVTHSGGAEDYEFSYVPKAGTSEASVSLDISSEHQAAHGSLTLVRDDCEDYDYFYGSKAGTSEAEEHLGISSEDQAAYRCVTHSGGAEDYEFSYVPKAGTSEASVHLDINSKHQAAYCSLTPVRDDCEDFDYSSCSKAGTSKAKERLGMNSEDPAAYSHLNLLGHFEDNEFSYGPKVGASEASESLNISSECQASYSSIIPVDRDNFMAMSQEPKEARDNDSAYLCPVTIEAEQRSDNENHSSNQDTSEGFECKRSHTEIYQAEAVSRTPHETPYSRKTKIKKSVEDSNMAFSFDPNEASLLGTETGQPLIERRYQRQETFPRLNRTPDDVASKNSAGVSERNPIALAWLNDPRLEVISF